MRGRVRAAIVLLSVGAWTFAIVHAAPEAVSTRVPPPAVPTSRAVLDRYCVTCHNERLKTAGLTLDAIDVADVAGRADVWEKVVRKLRTGAMPPQGAPRPDRATIDRLAGSLESALDSDAAAHVNPGRPMLHRLNRAEYANAIRDLLALDVDVASLLPPDDSAYGFDNISDVLGVSPSLQEHYLSAAEKISELAVGDPATAAVAHTYRVRQDLSQDEHLEGLPLGTVGGTLVRHTFPLDGDYQFQVRFFRTNFGNLRGLEHPHQAEITLDGKRIGFATIGGDADLSAAFENPTKTADAVDKRLTVTVPVAAGPHAVAIDFVEDQPLVGAARLQPFRRSSYDTLDWTGRPHFDSLVITGPSNVTGPGETPSRRRIFICRPSSPTAEPACAARIVSTLARRAFRQTVAQRDLAPILKFYAEGRRRGTFDSGIQDALQVILASPRFVFRIERDPERVAPGTAYRLDDFALASRLSFFLWSSIPDDELLEAAEHGRLHDPTLFAAEVRRMLADPKSEAIVANFAGQWLQLRNLRTLQPNSDEFPDFDDNLRQSFEREASLFFDSFIREDRSVVELLTARDTFVDERLARHYGIAGVYGSRFRRVALTDQSRWGLLGKGAVLAVTSHATRTSPVVRGKWILENILGLTVPPPPPIAGAGVFKEPAPGEAPKTMREQMAEHRSNPVCASCHKLMDPIGLSLENFDAVGAWRTRDAGHPIDASGELADGTRIDGVVTLREALAARPEVFVQTMTEKLLTYALGRGLDYHDMPAVRAIVRQAAAHDYRFSSLVLGIATSTPFRMRLAESRAVN